MTDNSIEQSTGPEGPASRAFPDAARSPGSTAKWKLLFIVLLVIIVTAAVYLLNKIHALESAMNTISETLRTGEEATTARINTLNSTIADLQAQQESMAASIASLYEQQPASNEDWALAEVEYLLTLALYQLQLAADLQGALHTMEAAASRLEGITDTELDAVRQQLAADIGQLIAVNSVDITGLSIYLADLIDRAETLPLRKAVIENDETTDIAAETVQERSGFSLQGLLNELWNALKGLVVIKYGVETRQALLPPEQEYFLYQNLRLELENARLSVIRKDTENLRTSVNLVKSWLQDYYDIEDNAVINVIDTLNMMAGVDLQPELPDISSSLETLRAVQHNHAAGDQTYTPP